MTLDERKVCNGLKGKQKNKQPVYSSYAELWAAWRDMYVAKYASAPDDLARVQEIYTDMMKRDHADQAFDLAPSKAGNRSSLTSTVASCSPVVSPVRSVVSPVPVDTATPVREAPVEAGAIVVLEKRLASLERSLAERDSVISTLHDEVAALRGEVDSLHGQVRDLDDAVTGLLGDVELEREQKLRFAEFVAKEFGEHS